MIKGNQTRMFCKDIMNLYLFFKISLNHNLNMFLLKTNSIFFVRPIIQSKQEMKNICSKIKRMLVNWWSIYLQYVYVYVLVAKC